MDSSDGWPLVGREEELAAVARALESGEVGGVALVGDAGIGKTGLVREALAGGDGEALERAAVAFADHAHLLLAAEAHAAAARVHRRAGRNVRARAAQERALALVGDCQGARTPLLDPQGLTSALSRREREVAMLAVTLSSRQIAEQLGLSVHTVHNNLHRVYAKLGIGGRRDLADLLAPFPHPR